MRQPWLWVGVIAIILAGIPWYLPEGAITPIVLGVPLWTLSAVGSSVALCGFLHWALSRHWNLVEDDEEATTGPTDTAPGERGERG
ncbi:hypothetical protein GCM10027563_32220 [Parasphingorhabdus pacifica]